MAIGVDHQSLCRASQCNKWPFILRMPTPGAGTARPVAQNLPQAEPEEPQPQGLAAQIYVLRNCQRLLQLLQLAVAIRLCVSVCVYIDYVSVSIPVPSPNPVYVYVCLSRYIYSSSIATWQQLAVAA